VPAPLPVPETPATPTQVAGGVGQGHGHGHAYGKRDRLSRIRGHALTGLALSALLLVAACGGALGRAEGQFADGRYPEAKQTLLSLESESAAWSDTKRAQYALYRGLTHAALGDREQAGVWLREARAIEDTHPNSLSFENMQRLKIAEGGMGGE
jgi:hypothetical protein